MEYNHYFHLFANGDDARNFIISETDFFAAFNRVGVCAANSEAKVVSFSIEDTHPHILLFGTEKECTKFKKAYLISTMRYIAATRGSMYDVKLNYELYQASSDDYLKNLGVYTIFQATKDGKKVLPWDYLWGSGSLYFRQKQSLPIWSIQSDGQVIRPKPIGELSFREKESMLHSRKPVPDDWLVCNGFLLPQNYIDIGLFESIYQTHNCFRVFLANSKCRDEKIVSKMEKVRGITMEYLESRRVAADLCFELFHKHDARWLNVHQRMSFAKELRRRYGIAFRQLATLCRLPEEEIRKYIR